jgi:hypothetical protein
LKEGKFGSIKGELSIFFFLSFLFAIIQFSSKKIPNLKKTLGYSPLATPPPQVTPMSVVIIVLLRIKVPLSSEYYCSVLIHDVLVGAGLVLPLGAAGVVVVLLLVTAVLLLRRRKSVDGEGGGSSIVVYPTHQSGGPQFL